MSNIVVYTKPKDFTLVLVGLVLFIAVLASAVGFMAAKPVEPAEVYVNDIPINNFRAKQMLRGVDGRFYQFDNVIDVVEVPIGHKPGDIVNINNGLYYKLMEEVAEGGDILDIPALVMNHSPNYYYGEIIYPDYAQQDTLVVIKPRLLNALIRQASTDGEIAHALSLTTRRY